MATSRISCHHDRTFIIDTDTTALIVIDMQRDFFADETGAFEGAMMDVVPRVESLLETCRAAGLAIVHTREGYASDMSDVSPFRESLGYVGRDGPFGRFLVRGEHGHDFLDSVRPLPGETVIDKPGFDGFFATDLDQVLRNAGVRHLILAGVTTQCCVHSTLRSAVDRGYWCLTVADCCAAIDPDLHDAALQLIAGEGHLFGWIADLADVDAGLRVLGRTTYYV